MLDTICGAILVYWFLIKFLCAIGDLFYKPKKTRSELGKERLEQRRYERERSKVWNYFKGEYEYPVEVNK